MPRAVSGHTAEIRVLACLEDSAGHVSLVGPVGLRVAEHEQVTEGVTGIVAIATFAWAYELVGSQVVSGVREKGGLQPAVGGDDVVAVAEFDLCVSNFKLGEQLPLQLLGLKNVPHPRISLVVGRLWSLECAGSGECGILVCALLDWGDHSCCVGHGRGGVAKVGALLAGGATD